MMPVIYVARSVNLSKWASDVGLSKHIFKVGVAEEPVKDLIQQGWAGEADWTLVRKDAAGDVTEADALDRLARKAKLIDPVYYPRIKGTPGLFKVTPVQVQNYLLVARALAGQEQSVEIKLKPADFATYLIVNAQR